MRAWVKRRGVLRERSVDDDWRCRACDGVCCRSFVAVELTWAEYETLERLGARRLEFSLTRHHKLVIDGGCEFLVGGRCGIYEHRPEVCRRFICDDVAGCEEPAAQRASAPAAPGPVARARP
jgi:Fe-S-cluster containining protein